MKKSIQKRIESLERQMSVKDREIESLKHANSVWKGKWESEKYLSEGRRVLHPTEITKINQIKKAVDELYGMIHYGE